MTIRYNIAEKRKVNYLRFGLVVGILLLVSAGLFLGGILNLTTKSKKFQGKKNALKACQDEKIAKTKKNKADKEEIDKIKGKWKRQRRFANDLVDGKIYPFIERLNKLEELLPAGVFISRVVLNLADKNKLQFSVAAISYARLMESYKAFLKYDLAIQKQTQAEGLYRANLQIKWDN